MSYENDCSCNYKPFIKKYSVSIRECRRECEPKPICPPPPKPPCCRPCRPPCCRPCRPPCPPRPCREERHEEGYPCCWGDEREPKHEEKNGRGYGEESNSENDEQNGNNLAPQFAVWEPGHGINIGGDNIETGY